MSDLYKEHHRTLIIPKSNVKPFISAPEVCARIYLETSRVVGKYASGTDEQIQEMSPIDLDRILQLVVLTDHYGKFGGKNILEENLPEYVSPLLMGSTADKKVLLRDLFERVCTEQQKAEAEKVVARKVVVKTAVAKEAPRGSTSGNSSSSHSKVVEPANDPLSLAKHYVYGTIINSEINTNRYFYERHSKVATDFALGNDQKLQGMTPNELEAILRLVVFANHHHEFYGIEKIQENMFSEYVSPLVQGNAEQKRAFLRDLCARVCNQKFPKAN